MSIVDNGGAMKRLIIANLLASLCLLMLGCASKPNSPGAANTGTSTGAIPSNLKPAPDFDLEKVAGGSLKSVDLKGKVTVVDFWATWCNPCIQEIPNYNELSAKYEDKGVVVLGVTVESGSMDDIKPKVDQFNMKYLVVRGNDAIVEGFGGLIGFPTTFVVTKDGKIYQKYLGLRTNKKDLIEKDIKKLLAEPYPGTDQHKQSSTD